MRTVADLHRLATAARCSLVGTRTLDGELVGTFQCPDVDEGQPLATATLLEGLAADDAARDPLDPAIVRPIVAAGAGAPAAALLYVQTHVRFVDEPIETFQTPSVTFARGYGDCDDSARALLALAAAAGVPGRLVYFLRDGQPSHVAAQLLAGGRYRWAEATIAAKLGEHPFAALKRLGLARPDLDGTPFLLEDGRAVPLTRSMGAMTDNLVDRVATPVTAQQLADALAAAWPSAVGGSPGDAIQMLVAQSAFETGSWAAVWNNNLGNVKYSGGTDYFTMTASEGSGASTTMVPSKWRSYPTLAAGAAAWLTFMANNYSTALTYATQGDVGSFVSALKNSGYFSGDVDVYTAGVQRYYSTYSSLTPSAAAGTASGAIATVTSTITNALGGAPSSGGGIPEGEGLATIAAGALLGALLGWLL